MHEYAHALAADRLGDDTPARQGRLTLNPMAHTDVFGTLLMPVVSALLHVPLFGWGRPVQTNPLSYTRKVTMRGGMALVSFAGPLANLIVGIGCSVAWATLRVTATIAAGSAWDALLQTMGELNFVLFFLNLIPVPPLDGSKIFAWIFGYRVDKALEAIESLGMIGVSVILIASGSLIGRIAYLVFDRMVDVVVGIHDKLS